MPYEIQFRINKMLHDERATVTASPQTIFEIFSIPDEIKNQVKTVILTSFEISANIYYGRVNTVTSSNSGGVIYPKQKIEIALIDLNYSPYFVASNASMGIEVWG